MREKIKIKHDETFEDLEIAELPDEALEGIAGGAGQMGTMTCTCDECGAVVNSEDEVLNHYLMTNHCSYHYTT